MSSLLFALMRENPISGLAVATLNVVVALCLVALSLLLGITIAMMAWAHALSERRPSPVRLERRTIA
ncbi:MULTISPECIES: hypothetical protein [Bradyrhizobium]|uniref:Uncharacterized protein n=1 Tax=Bradyrhizobium vignae TaxID=1549949 RepID=A0A2U3PW41_9BRAD|nr:hypothetical protein [Bradyrhizobium vignae]MBP0113419.1 hypothetical protein [Bradyrhizobium vignae]RXG97448.1 hypothetical protein EAV90_22515 [Bradyrhizobium vignae]SPP93381.1 conserved protein of unknown function [Bradyrhizobium vignae]